MDRMQVGLIVAVIAVIVVGCYSYTARVTAPLSPATDATKARAADALAAWEGIEAADRLPVFGMGRDCAERLAILATCGGSQADALAAYQRALDVDSRAQRLGDNYRDAARQTVLVAEALGGVRP